MTIESLRISAELDLSVLQFDKRKCDDSLKEKVNGLKFLTIVVDETTAQIYDSVGEVVVFTID